MWHNNYQQPNQNIILVNDQSLANQWYNNGSYMDSVLNAGTYTAAVIMSWKNVTHKTT